MTEAAETDDFAVQQARDLVTQLGHELMPEDEARELTERIKSNASDLAELVKRAKEGRAFLALGYATWDAYLDAELHITRQRAWQLLSATEVREELEEAASTAVDITERAARDIKGQVAEVAAEVREAVDNGAEPQEAVEKAVAKRRSSSKPKPAKAAPTEGPAILRKLDKIQSVLESLKPTEFVAQLAPSQRHDALDFIRQTRAWLTQLERSLKA